MKVLVTGAAGRLGSVTVRALLAAGFEVRGTDRVYRADSAVRIEVANLLDPVAPYPLLEGCQAVVHLANHPSLIQNDSVRTFNENVTMNMNLLEAVRQMGLKKVVFASTIQVQSGRRGEQPSALPYLPLDSELPPNPGNAYGLSKQATEIMLQFYARQHGIHSVALRFPYLIDREMLAHVRDPSHRRHRMGYVNRDEAFTCLMVDDAASLILAILKTPLEGFRVYFPAVDGLRGEMTVAQAIHDHFSNVPLRQPAEEMTSLVDISRITRETGWVPAIGGAEPVGARVPGASGVAGR